MFKINENRKAELKSALQKQLKSLLIPFLFLLVSLAGVAAIVLYKPVEEAEEIIQANQNEREGDVILENSELKFVMDSETTQFSVMKKSSGQVWYSNPPDAEKDSIALTTDKENLQSTLLLTYSTINGVDTLYNNYKYSIASRIYDIEAAEDTVKVCYSIGDVEKEYIVPTVVTEARMEELIAGMEKTDSGMVGEYYKKYDINNLGKRDDKGALLEQYPILKDEVIYVLREGIKDNLKSQFEIIFETAGYTLEEYQKDREAYGAESVSDKPVFNVNVIYRLDGEDLVVDVPMAEMEYKKDYPPLSLTILPFFGAGGVSEEGYLLVPEGGGGIIRFNNGKTAQNSYYASVYGWDMAQGRKSLVHETRTSFGVYGIAKENASFLCMMEEGGAYAGITADISGRNNSYNYVNATYRILNREQVDVADKYNGKMFLYEDTIPDEHIAVRYRFVDSGGYPDMAEAYHRYLNEQYEDDFVKNDEEGVPVAVEVVGAVDKMEQVLGVPVSQPLAVTTYQEMLQLIQSLKENGIEDFSVKLNGWMNGGVRQKILTDVKPVSRLGSKKDLTSLIRYAGEHGIDLYLDGITNYAYDSGFSDGFIQSRDTASKVGGERAELKPFDPVYFGEQIESDPYYLLKPDGILNMMKNLSAEAEKYGAAGVSFQDVGYELSSDFSKEGKVTRQTAQRLQVEALKQIRDSGLGIMTNMGNDYSLGITDFITNMDLSGSPYTIIDERVPFYQMAIHGYVNYAGKPLNITGNYEEELLHSAEYGAGLFFTFMEAEPTRLQNTSYTSYYGASFDSWKDEMLRIYTKYRKELTAVFNQRMMGHEVLTHGVTVTTYEDGTKVYVNYNYEDFTAGETLVPARDYVAVNSQS